MDIKEQFAQLIKLIELERIRIVETKEKVIHFPGTIQQDDEFKINNRRSYPNDNPVIENNALLFMPTYEFSFYLKKEKFFTASYVIQIIFSSSNIQKASELLQNEEIKNLFMDKQINRLLWSYLRGVVMNAFNSHSLTPIPLPLLP